MATNFPTGLDDFANYVDGDTIFEAALLNDMQFAIEALQAKVLINGATPGADDECANKKYVDDKIVASAENSDSIIKAWATVNANGTLADGFNTTSASLATGRYTVTWGTDFANTNYAVVGTALHSEIYLVTVESKAVGSCVIRIMWASTKQLTNIPFSVMAIGGQ